MFDLVFQLSLFLHGFLQVQSHPLGLLLWNLKLLLKRKTEKSIHVRGKTKRNKKEAVLLGAGSSDLIFAVDPVPPGGVVGVQLRASACQAKQHGPL